MRYNQNIINNTKKYIHFIFHGIYGSTIIHNVFIDRLIFQFDESLIEKNI